MDAVSAMTLLSTALLAMATRSTMRPEVLALALTHTLLLADLLQWFVRQVRPTRQPARA